MSNAAGSQSQLLRIAEVTFGTTPATPTMVATRYSSHSLSPSRDVFESKEMRQDRQRSDVRLGILMGVGDLDGELSAAAYDLELESVMNSAWASDVLKVGSTRKSFTYEDGQTDIGQYIQYTGAVVDKMSFDFKASEIVGVKMSFMAKSVDQTTATIATAVTAAPTDSPMDCMSGFLKKDTVAAAIVTACTLNLANNNEANKVIGSSSLQDIVAGRFTADGTLTLYFTDAVYLNAFLDETEFSLEIQAARGTKSYTFFMERVKATGFKKDTNKETSLQIEIPFMALAPTSGTNTTLRITRDLT